ncbi:MAG: hypothetical protein V4598_09825 [Bdellovibrionota bacterium]
MNERGEMNLFFVLMVVGLSGVMLLCALRLQRSFHLLEKRTELFLCTKETEGEIYDYMKLMGRTNWALKNLQKARLVMLFIPGLQGAAMEGEKLKQALKLYQNLGLVPFLKKMADLKSRGCPMDPRIFITPFQLGGSVYRRGLDGTAILRSSKWTYHYVSFPNSLSVDWNADNFEAINPLLKRISKENAAKLSSVLSSY